MRDPQAEVAPLEVAPRPCRTSLLRLVISTHGCYTCTPFRGENERKVGDILRQSLREVVESGARRALIDKACGRVCAYHEQNEALLALEAALRGRGAQEPAPFDRSSLQRGESAAPLEAQDFFV